MTAPSRPPSKRDARKIYAANWDLTSEDQTPQGLEILQFCKDEISAVFAGIFARSVSPIAAVIQSRM